MALWLWRSLTNPPFLYRFECWASSKYIWIIALAISIHERRSSQHRFKPFESALCFLRPNSNDWSESLPAVNLAEPYSKLNELADHDSLTVLWIWAGSKTSSFPELHYQTSTWVLYGANLQSNAIESLQQSYLKWADFSLQSCCNSCPTTTQQVASGTKEILSPD